MSNVELHIKEDEMGGPCSAHGRAEICAYNILMAKPQNLNGGTQLEDLSLHRRTVLKWLLKDRCV